MKVIYSIFVVILVLYSCNKSEVFTAKDNTQDNNTATIYRADLDKHATLTVSGELVDTKDEIEVSLGIYDDHSFRGTLNLYGEDIFNTVIHDATNDVAISIIDRVDNETYRLRTSDRKEYLLTEVSVDAGQITGTLNTENKLGQVESTFTIIANSIVDKMNLEYANSNV